MKLINSIVRSFSRPVALALLGLIAFTAASQAARIKMECKVKGYSTAGWIEIRPGSNTGGRVHGSGSSAYTDRVKRGEPLRITYIADSASERCKGGSWGGIYKFDHGYQSTKDFGVVNLPYVITTTCPENPNWDNVHADIMTSRGYFYKRIPIGSR